MSISPDTPVAQLIENRKELSEYGWDQLKKKSLLLRVLPPKQLDTDALDRHEQNKPRVLIDREPNSLAALSVPIGETVFETTTDPCYNVWFSRVVTPKVRLEGLSTVDDLVDQLVHEFDSKFLLVADVASRTGKQPLEVKCEHGICNNCLFEALNKGEFDTSVAVVNQKFMDELLKFSRNENPKSLEHKHLGVDFCVKDCDSLDNQLFTFTEPKFLGKCFYPEEFTVFIADDNIFAYVTVGATISNVNGVNQAVWPSTSDE